MYIPQKNIEDFAGDLIQQCMTSQIARSQAGKTWRRYYYAGSTGAKPAPYNKCFAHIDRTSSYLFSPSEVRFAMEFDEDKDEKVLKQAKIASKFLTHEFHRCSVDQVFASGVNLALVKGSAFLKNVWGHDGFDAEIIQPENMGVLREDVTDLHKQQAFCHQMLITLNELERIVSVQPNADELMKKARNATATRTKEEMESDFFHQMLIGGIAPVQQQGTSAPKSFSTVQLLGGPLPVLSPQLRNELVLFTELWVINDDTEDYTTIQYIDPGIVIEGKLRRRNICGVKGHTPFTKICANETENYFWGASELMQVRPLQDMMNRRISEVDRISRLRARPPFSITGSSIADEKAVALQTPGGMFVDSAPQTKIDKYAPDNPTDMIAQINDIIGWFDDMAGFSASLQGKGESGVRSGVHAETMVRTGSPRLRDRSLLVERQCAAAGEFAFKLLQAKNAEQFGVDKVEEKGNMAFWFKKKFSDEHQSMGFLLSQIPDDFRVTIDSHSSSAAFSEESKNLAFNLFKAGAIDAEDLIRLTNPSFADMLVDKLETKKKAEQELIKQHPELLAKFGKKK